MKKWKIISLLLFIALAVISWSWVNDKFKEKKDVSAYINLVNEWNKEQDKLQEQYKDEVLNQENPKLALQSLIPIIEANDEMIWRMNQFETEFPELNVTLKEYQQAVQSISDAYRFFYYAIDTGEKNMINAGEESLGRAETHFREHEQLLNEIANKNFISLKE